MLALTIACLLNAAALPSLADKVGDSAQAKKPPTVSCVRITQPPRIDGALDDACWQQASHCTGFRRTDKDLPPTEPTEAYICCDNENIYVAYRCHDSKPAQIKSVQRKRDGAIWTDDYVDVGFDTYHQHKEAYIFTVTPRGTQHQSMPGGNVPKIEWRGDWRAAACVNADGWTAEMAIPFSILRYPNGERAWGIGFGRYLARQQESNIWPPMGDSYSIEKYADWIDVCPPPYGERTILLPYALAESSRDSGNRLNLGLDLKRPLRGGGLLLGTYRPDFRDVEDVVESIDFTYTERYLPERRPFFIEAWNGPTSLLYTRRIEGINAGLAFRERIGRHQPSILLVDTMDQGKVLATNYDYSMGARSDVQAAFVTQQGADTPDNAAGLVALVLGRSTRYGSDSMSMSHAGTHVAGGGGDGHISGLSASRYQGHGRLSFWGGYSEVTPDYSDALSYVPEKGVRQINFGASQYDRREQGRVLGAWWSSSFINSDSLTGDPSYYSVRATGGFDFRNGRWEYASVRYGRRERFTDASIYLSYGWNSTDLYRSGSAGLELARRLGGDSVYVYGSQGFRLSENLSFQVSAEYLNMTSPIEPERRYQVVVTGAYDLSDERTISGRLVDRDEGLNFYATYRQAVRHGMDAFVIIGDPNADTFTRRVAIKMVWALFP